MEVKVAAPRCQLLLILLMSAVMLLPGTNGSLLLVRRTVTRTIVLQETIGKERHSELDMAFREDYLKMPPGATSFSLLCLCFQMASEDEAEKTHFPSPAV
ncbi:hypothetical protein STEG23_004098 [Scotinomys teguina]